MAPPSVGDRVVVWGPPGQVMVGYEGALWAVSVGWGQATGAGVGVLVAGVLTRVAAQCDTATVPIRSRYDPSPRWPSPACKRSGSAWNSQPLWSSSAPDAASRNCRCSQSNTSRSPGPATDEPDGDICGSRPRAALVPSR